MILDLLLGFIKLIVEGRQLINRRLHQTNVTFKTILFGKATILRSPNERKEDYLTPA